MSVTVNGTSGITFNNGGVQASPAAGSSSQTLTNVTTSRALGTTYTNSTNAPIVCYVRTDSGAGNAQWGVYLNSNLVISTAIGGSYGQGFSFIVPVGATYSFNLLINSGTLASWWELR